MLIFYYSALKVATKLSLIFKRRAFEMVVAFRVGVTLQLTVSQLVRLDVEPLAGVYLNAPCWCASKCPSLLCF
jgi:hypothetical protein